MKYSNIFKFPWPVPRVNYTNSWRHNTVTMVKVTCTGNLPAFRFSSDTKLYYKWCRRKALPVCINRKLLLFSKEHTEGLQRLDGIIVDTRQANRTSDFIQFVLMTKKYSYLSNKRSTSLSIFAFFVSLRSLVAGTFLKFIFPLLQVPSFISIKRRNTHALLLLCYVLHGHILYQSICKKGRKIQF